MDFGAHKKQDYGFDLPGNGHPEGNYGTANIGGNSVQLPWKSVAGNSADRLALGIKGPAADTAVHFISTSGNIVMTAAGNSDNLPSETNLSNYTTLKQVLVAGTRDGDQIKAWYYQGDTTKITTAKADSSATDSTTDSTTVKKAATRILAAAVNLAVYDKVEQNVCVVEVDKAIAPDASYIQTYLNTLYAPAVVKWKVSRASLSADISGTFDNTIGKSMGYNDAEKALCSLVKSQPYYDSNTLYLLYLEKPTTHSEIKGHMPFNELFGFIYGKNQSGLEVPRSMAHELGHGAFRLHHTFDKENTYVQDSLSTQNLMDYSNGTELLKYQWDECHKWHLGINWFEDGSEAASIDDASIACVNFVSKYFGSIFVTPGGKAIDIGDATPLSFISIDDKDATLHGTLASFSKNGVVFHGFYNTDTKKFAFYAPKTIADYKSNDDLINAKFNAPSISEEKEKEAQLVMVDPKKCEYDILINGKSQLEKKQNLSSCKCDESKLAKQYVSSSALSLPMFLSWHEGALPDRSDHILYVSPSGLPLEIPSNWRVQIAGTDVEYLNLSAAPIYGFEAIEKNTKKTYTAVIDGSFFKGYFDQDGNIYSYNITCTKHLNQGSCAEEKPHYHYYFYNPLLDKFDNVASCKDLTSDVAITGTGSLLTEGFSFCYLGCNDAPAFEKEVENPDYATLFKNGVDYKYGFYEDGGSLFSYKIKGQDVYIYANRDKDGKWFFYKYNARHSMKCDRWVMFDFPYPSLCEQLYVLGEATGHQALDAIGVLPALGKVADLINGVWYFCEDDKGNAYLSTFSGLIGFAEPIAKGVKYTISIVSLIKDGLTFKAAFKACTIDLKMLRAGKILKDAGETESVLNTESKSAKLAECLDGKKTDEQLAQEIKDAGGFESWYTNSWKRVSNWTYPPPSEALYFKYKTIYDDEKYFNQITGEVIYPASQGFKDISKVDSKYVLSKGKIIDRYGKETGNFLAPIENTWAERSLPPFTDRSLNTTYEYHKYEVLKDFEVESGEIAPWFGQTGGGTQYYIEGKQIKALDGTWVDCTIDNLVANLYLKRL